MLPLIGVGAAGMSAEIYALAGLLITLQKLFRVLTESIPPVNALLTFTVMLDPVALPVMVMPWGTVHW
jgi:hypothetical protein